MKLMESTLTPVSILMMGVQSLVAVAGFLMIHTLNQLNATVDRSVDLLMQHERRIARLEGSAHADMPRSGRRGE